MLAVGVFAPTAAHAAADLTFSTTAQCVDGATHLTVEVIDNDANTSTDAQIFSYNGIDETLIVDGTISEPNLLNLSGTGPLGVRVLTDNGATELYDSGLLDPCANNDPTPEPGTPEEPEEVGDFTFTASATCDNDGFTFSVRVQNSGPAKQITVTTGDRNSSLSQLAVVGDKTFSNSDPYFGWASISVKVDGVTLYHSGVRTALSADQCGIPMPAERTDIGYSLTAECGDDSALVTLTLTGTNIDLQLEGYGATGFSDHVTGNGPIQTSFTVPYDSEFGVSGIDPFDRYVYDSGYTIATEEYCVTPVASIAMWVECNDDDQPALNVHITSFFPESTTYTITWYVNDDSFTASPQLTVGELYQTSTVVPVGALIDGDIRFVANGGERSGASFEDEVAPDCSVPPTSDGGSGNPTPTQPTTAPTTTVSRGLPSTGDTSASLVWLAAALLLGGGALVATTRRRVA